MNGTRFSDWYGELERAFDGLRERCETVFAMGLSMGGTLTPEDTPGGGLTMTVSLPAAA